MRMPTQSRGALATLAALVAASVFAGDEGAKASRTADAIQKPDDAKVLLKESFGKGAEGWERLPGSDLEPGVSRRGFRQ